MSGTCFRFAKSDDGTQLPGAPREQRDISASVGRRPLVIGGAMSGTCFRFAKSDDGTQLPGAPREQRDNWNAFTHPAVCQL
jgi:hypothetical protein